MSDLNYTKKDFTLPNDPRWCPGCGDFSILSAVQTVMPKLGKKKEDIVFVSGIGCSSRFPYYMNTFGMHTIHGRATAIASGLKIQNPDLSVWVATGDGDGLSIGGNHLIHLLRRNLDINILLFNNEIYGLTKGQYSPTSKPGIVTKSSPYGSLDRTFNPASLALGAGATFVARTSDADQKHLQETLLAAAAHKGTSLVEIFQNCVIFNDGAHASYTDKDKRDDNSIQLHDGKPLIFGKEKNKGIMMKGSRPEVVTIGDNGITEADLVVHNSKDHFTASLVSLLRAPEYPVAMGVLYQVEEPRYEDLVSSQIEAVKKKKGEKRVIDLLTAGDVWEVK